MEIIKRLILGFFSFFVINTAFGQNGPVYKAVLYDNNGVELIGRQVQTKMSITTSVGSAVFVQQNTLNTDSLGLLAVRLGSGTITSGSLSSLKNLNYTSENYFFKVEVDTTINASSGYDIYSNTLIGSQFYAYAAFKSDSSVRSTYSDTTAFSAYSDTSAISLDNLFELNGDVTEMKEGGGIVISSVTKAQRDSIVTPAMGLLVYVSDINDFCYWNGASWIQLGNLEDLESFKKRIKTRLALRIGQ